jgi:hypothetical protein
MLVEQVARSPWNGWPDRHGMGGRMLMESVAGSPWCAQLGGLLLLAGWQSLISLVAPTLPWWSLAVVELVAGMALLGAGIWLWSRSRTGARFGVPQDLGWLAIVLFGVSSTFADLTTAVPYFGAVNVLLLDPNLYWFQRALFLAFYCLLYCGPLIVMVGARAFLSHRSDAVFAAVRSGVDWAIAKLSAPIILIAGLGLLVDGSWRLSFVWLGSE